MPQEDRSRARPPPGPTRLTGTPSVPWTRPPAGRCPRARGSQTFLGRAPPGEGTRWRHSQWRKGQRRHAGCVDKRQRCTRRRQRRRQPRARGCRRCSGCHVPRT
uniref:Uncharacterized protein n=1 Tax=Opuntia streptacantha TaxID=393608 RepID=A0A7C9CCL7_OPUST